MSCSNCKTHTHKPECEGFDSDIICGFYEVELCTLHQATASLLEAAKEVLHWAMTPTGGQSEEECREKQARTGTAVCNKLIAAIQKAEGV